MHVAWHWLGDQRHLVARLQRPRKRIALVRTFVAVLAVLLAVVVVVVVVVYYTPSV